MIKLYGIFNDNELSVSFNFNDIKSTYSNRSQYRNKNKSYFFLVKIDKIIVKNLVKIWPRNLMNSTFLDAGKFKWNFRKFGLRG